MSLFLATRKSCPGGRLRDTMKETEAHPYGTLSSLSWQRWEVCCRTYGPPPLGAAGRWKALRVVRHCRACQTLHTSCHACLPAQEARLPLIEALESCLRCRAAVMRQRRGIDARMKFVVGDSPSSSFSPSASSSPCSARLMHARSACCTPARFSFLPQRRLVAIPPPCPCLSCGVGEVPARPAHADASCLRRRRAARRKRPECCRGYGVSPSPSQSFFFLFSQKARKMRQPPSDAARCGRGVGMPRCLNHCADRQRLRASARRQSSCRCHVLLRVSLAQARMGKACACRPALLLLLSSSPAFWLSSPLGSRRPYG